MLRREKNRRRLEALEVSKTLESELAACYQQSATLFEKYDRGLIDDKKLNRLLHPIVKNLESHLRKLDKSILAGMGHISEPS